MNRKNKKAGSTKQKAYWALVKSDLNAFIRQSFRELYPGKEFLENWHIDAITYCLQEAWEGRVPRLIINMPPRHLKSFIVSVVMPAFILGRDPTAKIICVSYSAELSKTLMLDFRKIIESPWYKKLFPGTIFTKITEGKIVTSEGGYRYASSVGGSLTGIGGDFILIDDPIKPEDAQSEVIRDSTNEWFRSTLLSRLDSKEHGVIILVMQRLHVNDLTGYIEGMSSCNKLSLPAIATKSENIPIHKDETYFRMEGEPLHEEMESLKTLERIQDEIGPYNFAAQYQQTPECPDGAMFKRGWINLITKTPAIRPDGLLSISVDTALSVSDTADYSAITIIYSDITGHYILSAERGRWDYETLRDKLNVYINKYGDDVQFIVEAAGVGISLIHALRKLGKPCMRYDPKIDKNTRAAYIVPILHKGRVFILNKEGKNDWVEVYMNELLSFPHGRHDDFVDSLTQALPYLESRVNPYGHYER